MEVYENGFTPPVGKFCGVGLGIFDGLHRGHMALINTLINECRLNDLHSVIYTFSKHPENILRKKFCTPLIMTIDHKARILEKTGLDSLYLQEFNEEFSKMPAMDFVEKILVERMQARLVVVGFNYRFGYMGKGDTELLKRLGHKFGFKVIVIPPVKIHTKIVSSTIIRQYIQSGKMEKAFELLGRHFSVSGKVINGRQIGRTLGFPTANILPEPYLVMPATGVYVTRTLYDDHWYNSVTNVGTSPTLKQDGEVILETHMVDFEGELYDQDIEIFFLKMLRNERWFDTREELIEQIRMDLLAARTYWNE